MGLQELEHLVGVILGGVEVLGELVNAQGNAVILVRNGILPKQLREVARRRIKQGERSIESPRRRRIPLANAQVPLAGHVRGVTRVLQQLGENGPVPAQQVAPQAAHGIADQFKRGRRTLAGHEHDACLLTRAVGMEVGQPHAREREFIEIGGRDLAAEGPDIGVTEIVCDDVQNVGRSSDLL